jgi:hypothetical protein
MGSFLVVLMILLATFGIPAYLIKSKTLRIFLLASGLIVTALLAVLMLGGEEMIGVNTRYLLAHLINMMILLTFFAIIIVFWGMMLTKGWAFLHHRKSTPDA